MMFVLAKIVGAAFLSMHAPAGTDGGSDCCCDPGCGGCAGGSCACCPAGCCAE